MRDFAVTTWKSAADDPTSAVGFVVTLTDGGVVARFCDRPIALALQDDDGNDAMCNPGLLVDLSGMSVELDPREQSNPLPSMPALRFAESAIAEFFGEFPAHPGTLTVEISMVCFGLSWDDRIVILDGAAVDPVSVVHSADGSVEMSLLDPLAVGRVLVPRDLIDIAKLPASWNTAYIQQDIHGKPFPVCYGSIYRSEPLKVYDDGGAEHSANAQPIRRYVLAGHAISGTTATVHRSNFEIAEQQGGGYADYEETVMTDITTDGIRFSYVETDGADTDENPTTSPPIECRALSFDATSGELATLGAVIRDIIQRWTDIELDSEIERSFGDIVDAFSSVDVSVIFNGEGVDRASVAEIIDQRFAVQFPIGTARLGGRVILVPLIDLIKKPGPGYTLPVAYLRLGSECQLMDVIRNTGTIINQFEVSYKRREDNRYENSLQLNPENDFDANTSSAYYGRREGGSYELEDVTDESAASIILDYLRGIHHFPWYETDIMVPHEFSYMLPGKKVRLFHGDEPRIAGSCSRIRETLDFDATDEWRDAIVTRVAFQREGLLFSVIF